MEKLSEVIKNKRKELGLSQRDLATKIKVDNSYIAKIESGKAKKPNPDIILKLSKEFNMLFIDLLYIAGYSKLEIFELTDIGIGASINLKAMEIIKREEFKNYVVENDVGIFLDIKKILENYKKGKITTEQAVELMFYCDPLYLENKVYYFCENGDIEIDLDY